MAKFGFHVKVLVELGYMMRIFALQVLSLSQVKWLLLWFNVLDGHAV